jgi:hypothetical protein
VIVSIATAYDVRIGELLNDRDRGSHERRPR